jgi:hypothetical protein
MTLRQSRFAFLVLAVLVVVSFALAPYACAQTCTSTITITVTMDNSKKCTQLSSEGPNADANSPGYIPVTTGQQCVTWTVATALTSITAEFGSTKSPFYKFSSSDGKGSPAPSGQASGKQTKKYPYKHLTVGGVDCSNESTLGLIMR